MKYRYIKVKTPFQVHEKGLVTSPCYILATGHTIMEQYPIIIHRHKPTMHGSSKLWTASNWQTGRAIAQRHKTRDNAALAALQTIERHGADKYAEVTGGFTFINQA